jgi:hypothetical protein
VLQFILNHPQRTTPSGLTSERPAAVDQAQVDGGFKATAGPISLATLQHRISVMSVVHQLQQARDPCQDSTVRDLLVKTRRAYAKRGANLIQIPGSIFLVSAVLALGQVWGGLVTYMAACTTCVTTFVLIRWLGADALRNFNGRLARRIFVQLDTHPVRSVALLRLLFQTVPALNYALALSGIRFRSYLAGTLLGLPLPIALYCLFFGKLARWLQWPST